MNSHNQHYTINDLSNLLNLSNNTYGSITNEEIKKEIISHKQSIEAQKKIEMKKEKKDYSKEINQLIEMGFSKNEVEISIKAALGNIDKAIDYLYKGIKNIPINEESDNNEKKNNENDLNILDNKNENINDTIQR